MHEILAELLRKRLRIIVDHAWRDRDPAAHLEALKEVSLAITDWTQTHRTGLDARLRHYLANSSYDKALAHIGAETTSRP